MICHIYRIEESGQQTERRKMSEKKNMFRMILHGGIAILVVFGIVFGLGGCASQMAVSGREDSAVVLTNAYSSVRYDGCFWKNDLWESKWNSKKKSSAYAQDCSCQDLSLASRDVGHDIGCLGADVS